LLAERIEQKAEAHFVLYRPERRLERSLQGIPFLERKALGLVVHAARLVDDEEHVRGAEGRLDRGHAALVEPGEAFTGGDARLLPAPRGTSHLAGAAFAQIQVDAGHGSRARRATASAGPDHGAFAFAPAEQAEQKR
jgi:hypothetical protein